MNCTSVAWFLCTDSFLWIRRSHRLSRSPAGHKSSSLSAVSMGILPKVSRVCYLMWVRNSFGDELYTLRRRPGLGRTQSRTIQTSKALNESLVNMLTHNWKKSSFQKCKQEDEGSVGRTVSHRNSIMSQTTDITWKPAFFINTDWTFLFRSSENVICPK